MHDAIINSHKEHKCPCACPILCTRTKSQSMPLVLLQINTVSKVLLFAAHFSKMNSHRLLFPSRNFLFFLPCGWWSCVAAGSKTCQRCRKTQQNSPVCAGVGGFEMLLSCFSRHVWDLLLLGRDGITGGGAHLLLLLHCIQSAQTGSFFCAAKNVFAAVQIYKVTGVLKVLQS